MKVFLACPRDMNEAMVERLTVELTDLFTGVTFLASSQEFQKHFAAIGSWDGWADHVASGKDYLTRKDYYQSIMCVSETIGKSTAQIVNRSLARGKSVFFYDENRNIKLVSSIIEVDSENWTSGWKIIPAS
jgi:hypothetical protein